MTNTETQRDIPEEPVLELTGRIANVDVIDDTAVVETTGLKVLLVDIGADPDYFARMLRQNKSYLTVTQGARGSPSFYVQNGEGEPVFISGSGNYKPTIPEALL